MSTEPLSTLPYRTQLAGSLAALVNLWWGPTFRTNVIEASGAPVGLTEARVLWILGFRATAQPSELATEMEIGAPSITKAIAKLRSRGLVTLTTNSEDRRGRIIGLTEDGQRVTQRLYDIGDELVGRIIADWEPAQVSAFTELMNSFVERAVASANATDDIEESR